MITEDFVSFEVAKLLKEKGFDVPCLAHWFIGTDRNFSISNTPRNWNEIKTNLDWLSRPTLQMAMKWLREVHNIHCDIHLSFSEDPKNYPSGYYIYILNTKDGNTVENPGNNISEIHPLYKDKSCTPRNYHTYEDAVEAALKYALENLI